MQTIDDITNFIFMEDTPPKSDVLFILGTSDYTLSEHAAALYRQGKAIYILPSGKYSIKYGRFLAEQVPAKYAGNYRTEWQYANKILQDCGVPATAILREDKATHTGENAFFSKQVLEEKKITVQRGIICCKAFHARRAFMTYSWAFPEVEFFVSPVISGDITKENWHQSKLGIKRVLGELERCGKYFAGYLEEQL